MRELKTTLRNGFGQSREPPLHYSRNKNDSQKSDCKQSIYFLKSKMETRNHSKNGADSEKLTSRRF